MCVDPIVMLIALHLKECEEVNGLYLSGLQRDELQPCVRWLVLLSYKYFKYYFLLIYYVNVLNVGKY